MQKILIPTDFSPVADNALNYAIEIAVKFESQLFLYHVYSFNKKRDYNWNFPEDQQPFIKKIEQKMQVTKSRFLEKITQNGLSIETKIEPVHISTLFKTKALKHNIDLIVMGSKGATGFEKVIFGSVAATALEMAKVPVMVISPKQSFQSFDHIVLAADSKDISINILSPLQKLAMKFGAKVTILRVNTDSNENEYKIKEIKLDGVETTYRETPLLNSINESIDRFIEKESCDLLCMIRREKSFFESIFKKSVTATQVYNNRVPLLVIPENNEPD